MPRIAFCNTCEGGRRWAKVGEGGRSRAKVGEGERRRAKASEGFRRHLADGGLELGLNRLGVDERFAEHLRRRVAWGWGWGGGGHARGGRRRLRGVRGCVRHGVSAGRGGVSTCDGGGLLVPLGESSAREGEGREMWLRGKCGYAGCRPVMAAAFLFHSVSRPRARARGGKCGCAGNVVTRGVDL